MMLVLLTACTKQTPTNPEGTPTPPSTTGTPEVQPSAGKRIDPLPATLDMDTLTDATVAAAFQDENLVIASAGIICLDLTAYDYELFDMVDVAAMAVGDTIAVGKVEIKVESVEKTDGGLVVINGGQEQGGVELYTEGDTVYYESQMDGQKNYFEVGTAPFNLSDSFKFIDNSDLDNPGQTSTVVEFIEKLEGGEVSFTPYNTSVLFVAEEIAEITLSYVP